jgi:hypothetical protein
MHSDPGEELESQGVRVWAVFVAADSEKRRCLWQRSRI